MQLIDCRTADGSRHFLSLPETTDWEALREHLDRLLGVRIVRSIPRGVGAPWLEFRYHGYRFSIWERQGQTCLYVDDPRCLDIVLYQVAQHCERLLCPSSDVPAG